MIRRKISFVSNVCKPNIQNHVISQNLLKKSFWFLQERTLEKTKENLHTYVIYKRNLIKNITKISLCAYYQWSIYCHPYYYKNTRCSKLWLLTTAFVLNRLKFNKMHITTRIFHCLTRTVNESHVVSI